jgi:chromosome segregation ATPase
MSSSGGGAERQFASAEEAAAHWKARALELDSELSEFQEMSQALEAEMESNLDTAQASAAEHRKRAERAEHDLALLREHVASLSAQRSDSGVALQAQLRDTERERDALRVRVRDLELAGDAFEQKQREMSASIATAAADADRAVEERALLSVELDVLRERDQASLQRLRDELRDAQSEILRLQSAAPPLVVTVEAGVNSIGATALAESMLSTIRSLQQLLKS